MSRKFGRKVLRIGSALNQIYVPRNRSLVSISPMSQTSFETCVFELKEGTFSCCCLHVVVSRHCHHPLAESAVDGTGTSSVMEAFTSPHPLLTLDGYGTWRRHCEVGEGRMSAIAGFLLAMDWYNE
jgi:hypothetical protein